MAQRIVTLLGGFRMRLAPDQPISLRARKTRALLAYLAVTPGNPGWHYDSEPDPCREKVRPCPVD